MVHIFIMGKATFNSSVYTRYTINIIHCNSHLVLVRIRVDYVRGKVIWSQRGSLSCLRPHSF